MKKAILAVAAAATIAVGTMAAPSSADARCRSCGPIIVGVIGGLAAAAILGGSIAHAERRDRYVAYDDDYYDRPRARGCRGGYWARQRLYNRDGDVVGWSKPRLICP
jgi:hypothetical protein